MEVVQNNKNSENLVLIFGTSPTLVPGTSTNTLRDNDKELKLFKSAPTLKSRLKGSTRCLESSLDRT